MLRRPIHSAPRELFHAGKSLSVRLHKVQETLDLSQTELANLIGVSLPTTQRWLKEETKPLPIAENRCWEIEDLLNQASEVLTHKGMRQWFHNSHPEFGGMSPLLLLQTPGGIQKVLSILSSIEWGLPA